MIWSRKMVITGQDCLNLFHICETFADWLTGKRKILQESFFFLIFAVEGYFSEENHHETSSQQNDQTGMLEYATNYGRIKLIESDEREQCDVFRD